MKRWLDTHTEQLAICAVVVLFQLGVQWSFAGLAEFDAYYHVGISELYAERGLIREFPWMAYAFLTQRFDDPQLLLHLLMLPGIWLGADSTLVGKLVAALTAAGLGCTVFFVLRRLGVRSAAAFTLLFLVASPYVVARSTFIKSTSLFMALLFATLLALHERRRGWLMAIAWLSVYCYQGFPLLLVVAGIFVAASVLLDRDTPPAYDLLTPIVLGFACGLILNPFFPNDLYLLNFEIVEQVLLRPKEVVLGGEWNSVDGSRFIFASAGAVVFAFAGEQAMSITRAAMTPLLLTVRALTVLLLLGAMMSTRLLDYFVPMAMFATALSVEAALRSDKSDAFRRSLLILLLLIAVPTALFSGKEGLRICKAIARQISAPDYEKIAAYLQANSEKNEIVVSDWDDFPMLFRYDRHNRYLYGLSPTYGHGKDPQFFAAHKLMFEGRVGDPETLLKTVGSRYLLIARSADLAGRKQLLELVKRSPLFKLAAASGDVHLFELKQ